MDLLEETLEELKTKKRITREDIDNLLASIGKPGENREAKIEAVKSFNKGNSQGVQLETTLESYGNY